MDSIRRHLSYANVIATLALVFAMSGGALAASRYLVNSTKQINPKVLKALKGHTGAHGATGAGGAAGPKGAEGPKGANGREGPTGEAGPAGTARAYAVVIPEGAGSPIVKDAKNVTGATRASAGNYCVAIAPASGINLETVRPLVTVNWNESPSFDVGLFAYDQGAVLSCPVNTYEILTGDQKTAGALPVRNDEVAFNIAVP